MSDQQAQGPLAAPGRNDPCPCGSGNKYKRCCGAPTRAAAVSAPSDQQGLRAYLQEATRLRRAGRFADSLVPMQHAARLSPRDPVIHHDLGLTYVHCAKPDEAIRSLGRAVALKDDFAHAHYRLGIALELCGREEEAVEAYRRALARDRRIADAAARLAKLLLSRGRRKEAIDAYRAAAAAAPGTSEGRLNELKALITEENDAEAEAAARRLLADEPDNHVGHWMLGTILAESGRFDEAIAAFERAIAIEPQQGIAYYDLVRCRPLRPADRSLIDRMQAVASRLQATDQRILLELALGKAFDDLKEYGTAMRSFGEANRLKKSIVPFDRNGVERRVDRLIALFTPEFLARHRAAGSVEALPILILGMPRSGTTLVEQMISNHPSAAGAGELQFWGQRGPVFLRAAEQQPTSPPELLGRIASDYLALLREFGRAAARVTDKMPFNFLWAGLAHLAFPRGTIIHCRRHALDTCISIFSTYFAPRPDFSTDAEDLVFYYRQYLRLMAHWRAVLPPERFLEVDYETLIASPESEARRLVAACGLDWDQACLQPERNDRIVKTASKWQARQPIYATAVARWRLYEPWLGPLRALAPDGASSAG